MSKWVIPCEKGFITNIEPGQTIERTYPNTYHGLEIGDIVFVYVSQDVSELKYETELIDKRNLETGFSITLEMIRSFDYPEFKYENMPNFTNAFRNPQEISPEFERYIDEVIENHQQDSEKTKKDWYR